MTQTFPEENKGIQQKNTCRDPNQTFFGKSVQRQQQQQAKQNQQRTTNNDVCGEAGEGRS